MSLTRGRQTFADLFLASLSGAGQPVDEVTRTSACVEGSPSARLHQSTLHGLSGLQARFCVVFPLALRQGGSPSPATPFPKSLAPRPPEALLLWKCTSGSFLPAIAMVSFPSIGRLGCHGSEPPLLGAGNFGRGDFCCSRRQGMKSH